ncbi:MAG TPA: AarF/UbiB family protein [Gemmatimonadales bacterium]
MLLAPRHLPRLTAIIGLLTRHGLGDIARKSGLRGLVPDADAEAEDGEPSAERAVALRERLVELGPAYVKLGQVLSTRPDMLPPGYVGELARLQDDVEEVPLAEVEQLIETELGGRLSKLFASFEPEPLGSASLGQVHAARLRDGREVVVKVQRPDVRERLVDDIEFFRELAAFLTTHTQTGERMDIVGVVQQLERSLADELDYRTEARNAAILRRNLAEYRRIAVPRVIRAYCTGRVLTTERVRGVRVDAISPLTRLEHDFEPVVDELTRAYLKQITIDGHFHADPHPGNVFVLLPSAEEAASSEGEAGVRVALIDFGMTARLSLAMRERIVSLLLDLADNHGDRVAETLVELGRTLPGFDREAFVHDVAGLVARNYDLEVGEVQTGQVLYQLIDAAFERGLRLPPELTLLAKAMFNLDGVTRALDPSYSPIETIRDFGSQIAADRTRRELDPRRVFQLAADGSNLLSALPHRLDVITQRLAANDFETRVHVAQIAPLITALQKVANRIFSGVVLAGLVIASAMLLPHRRVLGTIGFVLAAAIGLWMVVSILWSDRRRE